MSKISRFRLKEKYIVDENLCENQNNETDVVFRPKKNRMLTLNQEELTALDSNDYG